MASVALVVLDTLRWDAFENHFDWLPGRRFDNAWSTSHWTAPAHGSLFTGRYASEVGIHAGSEGLDCPSLTLAEQLSAAGYTTRAFSANAIVSRAYDYDRGFETFQGPWKNVPLNHNIVNFNRIGRSYSGLTKYRKAIQACFGTDVNTLSSLKYGFQKQFLEPKATDAGARDALEFVTGIDFGADEFLYLNLMEAHGPYQVPPEYRTVELDKTLPNGLVLSLSDREPPAEAIQTAYDDCARYLSDIYQDIFTELRREFDYVITVADHGELLGEHGYWKHTFGVYPELTHVPLVVTGEETETVRYDETVNLLDVHNTVLDATGVNGESRGQSLLGSVTAKPSLVEYHGIPLDRLKNAVTEAYPDRDLTPYERRLRGFATPTDYYRYETLDGAASQGDATVEDPVALLESLDNTLEEVSPEQRVTHQSADEQVVERLRELGYA